MGVVVGGCKSICIFLQSYSYWVWWGGVEVGAQHLWNMNIVSHTYDMYIYNTFAVMCIMRHSRTRTHTYTHTNILFFSSCACRPSPNLGPSLISVILDGPIRASLVETSFNPKRKRRFGNWKTTSWTRFGSRLKDSRGPCGGSQQELSGLTSKRALMRR